MHRNLSILVLSAVLTFAPVSLKSSLVRGAAREHVQLQKPGPPQSLVNSDSSKMAASKGSGNPDAGLQPDRQKTRPASASRGLTRVQMRNVDFHVDDTIVIHIRNMRGVLLRKNKGAPPFFDDKESFSFKIDSATVGITTEHLADLLNNYVFSYPNAPVKDLSISMEGDQIRMKGTMHKVTDLPFEMVGDLRATPEGKIQVHPTSIKTAAIPLKGLMNLFGIELDELIKATESRGVKIDDNDITLDPEIIMPPPRIRGKISAVRIEGDQLIEVFGPENEAPGEGIARSARSHRRGSNYMYYRGGTIRFGKLTMTNADLKLVDRDPKNPFDFSIDHYNSQLVAGYTKNTPRLGLVVYMPDYSKVQGKSSRVNSTGGSLSKR